jgi:tetratricopeptide (TPR) repeat protein
MALSTGQFGRSLARTTYLADIEAELAQLGHGTRNILVYYGEPEYTWQLSQTLCHTLRERGQLCAFVNGEGLATQTASALEKGLLLLRSNLGAGGIDFSCFDIAYLCYFTALNSHQAIDSVEFTRKMGRADTLSAFADLVGAAQDLDLSRLQQQMKLAELTETARLLVPQIMSIVGGLITDAIPYGVFFAKLAWFFVGLEERRRLWWIERGNRDLREMKDYCVEPFEVLDYLPVFLARDLKHHVERPDLPEPPPTAVVFVDDYDQLVDPQTQRCTWLETLLSEEEVSDRVLWVITARQPLDWLEDARQVSVLPLAYAEADAALQGVGVDDAAIRQGMLQAAQGSPWHLEVCVDTWKTRRRKDLPPSETFSQQWIEVLRQAGDTWEADERQIRQLLAVPRSWDRALYQALLSQFLESPLDDTAVQQRHDGLMASPFVLASGEGSWRWHPQVRAYLLESQSPEQRDAVHGWLFTHYQTLSAEAAQPLSALDEALYHALSLEQPEEALDWWLEAIGLESQQRPQRTIPTLLRSLLAASKATPAQVALAQTRLGQALAALLEWEAAEPALEAAVQLWRDLEQTESAAAGDTWHTLAEVYLALENPFDALKASQNAVRIRGQQPGPPSLAYAEALSRQAEVYWTQDRIRDAIRLSDQAMEIAMALPEVDLLKRVKLKLDATLVRVDKYTLDEAEKSCLELLALTAQLPGSEDHFYTIRAQALMGDIYRNMGSRKGQQAFDCYQQAIEKAEGLWGPDNEWTLAFLDAQIALCRKLGDYDKADEIATIRQLYDPSDPSEADLDVAGSLNRVGMALQKQGKYGKAEPLFKRALAMRKRLLGAEHPDVATSLNNLAYFYDAQGRYSEAEPLYGEALAMRKRLLGAEHPYTQATRRNLEQLQQKQNPA